MDRLGFTLWAPLAAFAGCGSAGGQGTVDAAAADSQPLDSDAHATFEPDASVQESYDGGDVVSVADALLPLPDCGAPIEAGAIVTGLTKPFGIAVDDRAVYWTNDVGGGAVVMKASICGGDPIILASAVEPASNMAIDRSSVYWIGGAGNEILSVPINGGATKTLASSSTWIANDIAVDGTDVYFSTGTSPGDIMRVSATGGPAEVFWTAPSGTDSVNVAVDSTNVYFATRAPAIMKVPKAGGAPVILVSNSADAAYPYMSVDNTADQNIATDNRNIYWPDENTDTVLEVPIGGGQPTTLTVTGVYPISVATDGIALYWIVAGLSIEKMPVDGGTAVTLASGAALAGANDYTNNAGPILAVDSTSIYWLTPTAVMKAPK